MSIANQLIPPQQLKSVLDKYYNLRSPLSIKLIGSGFNHNYQVKTAKQKFVLRIYLHNKYYIQSSDDFKFELDLLEYLTAQNIPVSSPIKNNRQEYLSSAKFKDDLRYFALFNFAKGKKFDLSINEQNIYQLGKIIATLHTITQHFHSNYYRYSLDLDNILVEPIEILKHHLLSKNKQNLDFFQSTYEQLLQNVRGLSKTSANFGLIHGDLNESNIHFEQDLGFTILDFDHCGYGWRAYDLIPFWDIDARLWHFFIEGYESVRNLSPQEKELMPTFAAIRDIWDMGDVLRMMPVWGEQPDAEYLDQCLERLYDLKNNFAC